VTAEFLHIWRKLLAGEKVSYHGEHLSIEEGKLMFLAGKSRHRLFILVARHLQALKSLLNTSTSISPGVSRSGMSPRK
jgi:alkanesulfonate monooxygenase SsuD/methylene tetrahydromethanopterin reductase-like flavin-dependent oxidoreductase (luciferase family)